MKTLAAIAAVAVSAFSLSACMTGYDHRERVDASASVEFVDGYYDDAYGPYDAGYWGADGVFMYRGADHQFHRDDAGHFRRDQAQGFHTIHGPAAHPDSDHHDNGDHHDNHQP